MTTILHVDAKELSNLIDGTTCPSGHAVLAVKVMECFWGEMTPLEIFRIALEGRKLPDEILRQHPEIIAVGCAGWQECLPTTLTLVPVEPLKAPGSKEEALKMLNLPDTSVGKGDIKKAYHAMMRSYHPDRHNGQSDVVVAWFTQAAQALNEAKQLLLS